MIFNNWKEQGIKKIPEQKLTKWRPKQNAVLITKIEHLQKLFQKLNDTTEMKLPKNLTLLFETDSVLRVQIN